jgi:hypothetical protein
VSEIPTAGASRREAAVHGAASSRAENVPGVRVQSEPRAPVAGLLRAVRDANYRE